MRRGLIPIAVALTASLASAATAEAARVQPAPVRGTSSPRVSRLARALSHARRSPYLWATVNICTPSPHRGGVIGIRGEMPSLGFRATMTMTLTLQQYSTAHRRFVAMSGPTASHTVSLGRVRRGIHQGGAEFPFASNTGLLDGRVTFTWTRGRRRLLQVTRQTSAGHHSAAYGTPAGHSTAACRL